MSDARRISPCLWFDGRAEEAATFYVSVFPDSRIDHVVTSATAWPGGEAGAVILVEFTIAGQSYQALNGGPQAAFSDAVSLSVNCRDQAEVDRYWEALLADGGRPMACGWLKDKFGMRWQIVPDAMMTMLRTDDPVKLTRVMTAMTGMIKLDVAALTAAFNNQDTAAS